MGTLLGGRRPSSSANSSVSAAGAGGADTTGSNSNSERQPPSRLARDRRSDPQTISVAGCGFLAAADAVLRDLGGESADAIASSLTQQLRTLRKQNTAANRGWFSHFVTPDGQPIVGSEVSTIDTALLFAGHQMAAEAFAAEANVGNADSAFAEHRNELDRLVRDVDLAFVCENGLLSHGFRWPGKHGVGEPQMIEHLWDDTSEGALVYWMFGNRMRAEDLRSSAWQPSITRFDYPLFVYCYPLCFPSLGSREQRSRYRELLVRALEYQHANYGFVGQTATDGPDGYSVGSPSVVAPILLAALATDRTLPHVAETRRMLADRGVDPMTTAYDVATDWRSDDAISIDIGSAVLLEHVLRNDLV